MPCVNRSALVSFTAAQMYALVSSVRDYPQFVPHCRSVNILQQSEQEVVATLQLDSVALGSAFTTRNQMTPDSEILMQLENGPFKSLQGRWLFKNLGSDGCKISLDLDFEFSNGLVALAFARAFKALANNLFDAFISRAGEVYRDGHH